MGRYNPVVRRNILLQNMTSFVERENQVFDDLQNQLLELNVDLENEDVLQVLSLYDSLVQDSIVRANQVRDMLNAFFDETGELGDEDVYLHFPHYETVIEDAPDYEDAESDELELLDEVDDSLPFEDDIDVVDDENPFDSVDFDTIGTVEDVSRETEQPDVDTKIDIEAEVDGLNNDFDFNSAFK